MVSRTELDSALIGQKALRGERDAARRERDETRAEAAALRSALRRLTRSVELAQQGAIPLRGLLEARAALATDAGKAALDAVRLAQRALADARASFAQTHVNAKCEEVWKPYGRHAPDCDLSEAEELDAPIAALDASFGSKP